MINRRNSIFATIYFTVLYYFWPIKLIVFHKMNQVYDRYYKNLYILYFFNYLTILDKRIHITL